MPSAAGCSSSCRAASGSHISVSTPAALSTLKPLSVPSAPTVRSSADLPRPAVPWINSALPRPSAASARSPRRMRSSASRPIIAWGLGSVSGGPRLLCCACAASSVRGVTSHHILAVALYTLGAIAPSVGRLMSRLHHGPEARIRRRSPDGTRTHARRRPDANERLPCLLGQASPDPVPLPVVERVPAARNPHRALIADHQCPSDGRQVARSGEEGRHVDTSARCGLPPSGCWADGQGTVVHQVGTRRGHPISSSFLPLV